jgi:hypothetical protein
VQHLCSFAYLIEPIRIQFNVPFLCIYSNGTNCNCIKFVMFSSLLFCIFISVSICCIPIFSFQWCICYCHKTKSKYRFVCSCYIIMIQKNTVNIVYVWNTRYYTKFEGPKFSYCRHVVSSFGHDIDIIDGNKLGSTRVRWFKRREVWTRFVKIFQFKLVD